MTPAEHTPLVLLAGPIAAGKSAVSRALADALRTDRHLLALVELDAIADMARPTLPDWAVAHRLFASITAEWLTAGLDLVIAESVSSREELDLVRRGVPAGTPPGHRRRASRGERAQDPRRARRRKVIAGGRAELVPSRP